MAPNPRSQNQEDGSAIISGHKIALNVHYDNDQHVNGHVNGQGDQNYKIGSANSNGEFIIWIYPLTY